MGKIYRCECGKEFTNPQAFNGHKSRCIIHHSVKGNLDEWETNEKRLRIKRAKSLIKSTKESKEFNNSIWIKEKHKCEHCGKIMTERFGSGRFCSRSCANSRSNSNNSKVNTLLRTNKINAYNSAPKYCSICGNKIDYEHRNRKTCSKQCYVELLRQIQNKIVDSGNHKHWLPRNILSYAESFWKEVLINNNIEFEHNYSISCYNTTYFLDFYIKPNIDLEIDGKQHTYEERKIHDTLRDRRLSEKGIVVYRIPYINPKNKEDVRKQINEFLLWYNDTISKQ